jgi:transcriptional regulator
VYVPQAFSVEDRAEAIELIRANPFGTLISVVDGESFVSHLPFTVAQIEPRIVLAAHCAKASPHWRHFPESEVRAIFQGEHGYVSPRWYGDPKRDVPTWNYAVVHCTGTVRLATGTETDAILRALVDEMEADAAEPWTYDDLDLAYRENMKQGIVAFYLDVAGMVAKFKLSQNRSQSDRQGAIDGLRETGRESDRSLADAMERCDRSDRSS